MNNKWSNATLLLYISIAFIIALLFRKTIIEKNKKKKLREYIIYYFIIYIILIIFSCFRTVGQNIGGADSINYINMFENVQKPVFDIILTLKFSGNEYIFFYLLYLVRCITSDYHIMFFVLYSIIITSYIFFVHKEIHNVNDWGMLLLLILPYIMSFNIVRNCLAVSITIFAIYFLKEKKNKLFILFEVCAFLTHYTAVITLIFYFYYKIFANKLLHNKKIYIILLVISYMMTITFIPIAINLFLKSGYSGYVGSDISLFGYFAPKILLLICIYFFYDSLYKELENNNQIIYLSYFSFLCLILPMVVYLGGANRIILYFDFAIMILWINIQKIIKEKIKYNGKTIKQYIQIFSIIFVVLWIVFKIHDIGFSYGIMPYYTDLF